MKSDIHTQNRSNDLWHKATVMESKIRELIGSGQCKILCNYLENEARVIFKDINGNIYTKTVNLDRVIT